MNTTLIEMLYAAQRTSNSFAGEDNKFLAISKIKEAVENYQDFANACAKNNWDINSVKDLSHMIKWVKNMPEQSDSEELKEYTVSDKLKKVLIATHNTGANYIVFPPNTFEDEYLLPNYDKSYVIFHKKDTNPNIIDKLDENKQPKSINVWKNWVMTITFSRIKLFRWV